MIPGTIVLLPGLYGTDTLFADLISALPTTLSINIATYPTQKFLSFSELVECVERAVPSAEPFLLVAESFGAPLAVKFAAKLPPNLAGLVISAGFVTSPAGKKSWLLKMLARTALCRFSPPRWFFKRFLIGKNPPANLEAKVREALKSVRPEVLAERLRAIADSDLREDLARTQIPILYLQAEYDALVGPRSFEEIRRIRPDTVMTSIPAPHMLLQTKPREGADAILQFIRQLAA